MPTTLTTMLGNRQWVCHRLYMQPGKPYSDLGAARLHAMIYRVGIAAARADIQAGHVREGSSWFYPYFARGSANGQQRL